jgi:hypothetical protein
MSNNYNTNIYTDVNIGKKQLPKINCSIDVLSRDIRLTKNPLKKTILKNFLDIKMKEITYDTTINTCSIYKHNVKNREVKSILKKKSNISREPYEPDKEDKIKAYKELIKENTYEKTAETREIIRGKTERKWDSHTLSDPKYEKYVKEDSMNNKLMERLNSEIDFRTRDEKNKIVKPFEDDDNYDGNDIMNEYASIKIAKKNI